MDDITLDDVFEMLEEVEEDIDYENVTTLIDEKYFDSFDIIATINAIDEEFDVTVPAKDIVPENFNSAAAIHAMILRLADED